MGLVAVPLDGKEREYFFISDSWVALTWKMGGLHKYHFALKDSTSDLGSSVHLFSSDKGL